MMIYDLYPDGIDVVWIASDQNDNLGVFISAGAGPIPDEVLSSSVVPFGDIETLLDHLPESSKIQVFGSISNPDAYTTFAKRGIYVYDWLDVERARRNERTSAYELVAIPQCPLLVEKLPEPLARYVQGVRFHDVNFAETNRINVRNSFKCQESLW